MVYPFPILLGPGTWRVEVERGGLSQISIPHPAQSEVATAARNSEGGAVLSGCIYRKLVTII